MNNQSEPENNSVIMESVILPPKLSLFSLPNQLPEPSGGSASPPRRVSASVPFQWEEAPGKPRAEPSRQGGADQEEEERSLMMKSLELPPRLLGEVKFTNMTSSSPTTVLYGPEVGRSLSFTFSFRSPTGDQKLSRDRVGYFGSSRWGSFRKNNNNNNKVPPVVVGGSFDISPKEFYHHHHQHGITTTSSNNTNHDYNGKVKISRIRRRGSLSSFSNAKSHLLASIYESFKQVVPWRRKQEKQRKMGSSS
ncbi:uncharacterized protein At4g00950 [Cannabis sativa]|uniref:uncharacterized protein At4g00950 n=1 Tax=Cannabis sativa TaxID=3483 RepID=UPI0029C9CCFC|nr:uncharacterized protein At4g00950 [Cannabis sativa]